MQNHYAGLKRVSMAEARRRALSVLPDYPYPLPPSAIAHTVYPGHKMKAQGAAFSVAKLMRGLEVDGLARYMGSDHSNGWIITFKGRQVRDNESG